MDSTSRGFFVAFVVLLGAALGFSILTGGMMGPGMMGSGGMSGRGWAWGLGMGLAGLSMLAFWGALIVGIGLLFRGAWWPTERRALARLPDRHPQATLRRWRAQPGTV